MKKKFVSVKRTKFFVALTPHGDPIPFYGFTFWKKQMIAKIKKQQDPRELIVAPVVFCEAQNYQKA